MSEADIRPAGLPELPLLAALHAQGFAESWSIASLAELLAMPGAFALLARAGAPSGAPLGFILCRAGGGECEIITLAVPPAARRRGIGRSLVAAACRRAEDSGAAAVFLEVAEDNPAARALYARCGFDPVGRRPGYYRRPSGAAVDALVLRRGIAGGP